MPPSYLSVVGVGGTLTIVVGSGHFRSPYSPAPACRRRRNAARAVGVAPALRPIGSTSAPHQAPHRLRSEAARSTSRRGFPASYDWLADGRGDVLPASSVPTGCLANHRRPSCRTFVCCRVRRTEARPRTKSMRRSQWVQSLLTLPRQSECTAWRASPPNTGSQRTIGDYRCTVQVESDGHGG